MRGIRDFFGQRGYLEVETPVLSAGLIPESPIEIFETTFYHEFQGDRPLYLIPSPEVHMKKLIAQGSGDIFQITKSFRNSEQMGPWHNPEFTMLEWYSMEADYMDSLARTEELFEALTAPESPRSIRPPFRRMSVQEAFRSHAGFDLAETQSAAALKERAKSLGLLSHGSDGAESWESIYHQIFLTLVEPKLPTDRPLVLYDYPRQIATLAKDIRGAPWKERWELYVQGIEIANCYSEETDARKVEEFFRREALLKASSALTAPDIDSQFLEMFSDGFPECSGVAMGIDRLIMALSGEKKIEGVIFFPLSDILQH